MTERRPPSDFTRIMLSALLVGLLVIGSFLVLRPFLMAVGWAAMIVIPTWPLMVRLKDGLGGRRGLAVCAMALLLCALVFVPVWLVVRTIVENTDTLAEWARAVLQFSVPPAPPWIAGLPVVGAKVTAAWERFAVAEQKDIAAELTPYLVNLIKLLPAQLGNAGIIFVHFLLTLIISIVFYLHGETVAGGTRAFARRLAGDKGEQAVLLAARAIRAVAMGIVVTALVQAVVAWVGFVIAGIPYAILLAAIIFALSVVQLGPLPVLAPTVIWIYWSGSFALGTFLLIWSLFVLLLDNFLRPYLIRRGADVPLLLIFAGVIGGIISFGIIGLFIGPVILAVTYTLTEAWVAEDL